MLTPRERYWAFARFEPLDRLPYWGDWVGPWHRWQREGAPIPPEVVGSGEERAWAIRHFGFDGIFSAFWGEPRVPVNIGLYPGYPYEVFEETESYRIYRAGNGTTVKQFKNWKESLHTTQWLDYPIKTRADWQHLRDSYLNPDEPARYPAAEEWESLKQGWAARKGLLSIDAGSLYGFIRDWMGVERLSLALYDDPEWVQEMASYLATFYIGVLRRAVDEVDIDFGIFWEDMCYNAGPMLSPAMFRRFLLEPYQRVTGFLAEHGVSFNWVDCDGNIEALIPLWIEGGVRGFYPLEVASGMDAARLRAQYGQEILLWGNVDKRALTAGPAAIDAEMARLAPVAAQGGFIPLVDHGVPDDVPWQHYLYYLEQRKRITGWGE